MTVANRTVTDLNKRDQEYERQIRSLERDKEQFNETHRKAAAQAQLQDLEALKAEHQRVLSDYATANIEIQALRYLLWNIL